MNPEPIKLVLLGACLLAIGVIVGSIFRPIPPCPPPDHATADSLRAVVVAKTVMADAFLDEAATWRAKHDSAKANPIVVIKYIRDAYRTIHAGGLAGIIDTLERVPPDRPTVVLEVR
jgi:hypothetical protein